MQHQGEDTVRLLKPSVAGDGKRLQRARGHGAQPVRPPQQQPERAAHRQRGAQQQ